MTVSCYHFSFRHPIERSILTWRLLPVVSLSASNPPGPILLLLDFFEGRSPSTALFPAPPSPPMSAVIFSLSIILAEGVCANDFRDIGLVAGNVTSSREDIVKTIPGRLLTQLCSWHSILGNSDVLRYRKRNVNKQNASSFSCYRQIS